MAEYYTQRASAGLIIAEATTISPQANGWVQSPGIYTDEMVQGWKKIVDSVHQAGGKMFLQLWHMGRASHSDFHGGQPAVAPSAIAVANGEPIRTPKGKQPVEIPRALESKEIPGIVQQYRSAAENALAAGFDGVEIHAANGYLIDQFLQSKTNQRDDEYGGSIEKRYRFLGEVIDAVTSVFPSKRVGVRLSPNGIFNDMGSPEYREQFSYAAEQLDNYRLAYLHIVDGLEFGFHEQGEAMVLSDFRKLFAGPLMGNCGYDQQSAEAAILNGDADMIAFGRPYISNPDLVERFQNDWPLTDPGSPELWYSHEAEGYTTFPAYGEK
jgi:N-ethylmaleimide reductase